MVRSGSLCDLSQAGDCYGVKLVAEGPGEIRYVDNDAFGVAPGEFAGTSGDIRPAARLRLPTAAS